jgi:uncharacterized protein (TIGR03083 family)
MSAALEHLRVVTGAFLRDAGDANPTAGCADIRWSVAELVAHLGAAHRWAAANSREAKRHPRPEVPQLDVSLTEWYSTSRDDLLATLDALDPLAKAYTLSKTNTTVAFWHRRQLFETLVHLWDLRSAVDAAAPPPGEVTAEVHADGVSELFDVFLPRARTLAPLGGGVELIATDTGDRWSFGNDWQRDGGHELTATVSAPAADLLLWVWNRGTARDAVVRDGDLAVIERFERARIRP